MSTHLGLVAQAKTAIDKVYADRSVPASTTRESLEGIVEDLEMKIEALRCQEDEE